MKIPGISKLGSHGHITGRVPRRASIRQSVERPLLMDLDDTYGEITNEMRRESHRYPSILSNTSLYGDEGQHTRKRSMSTLRHERSNSLGATLVEVNTRDNRRVIPSSVHGSIMRPTRNFSSSTRLPSIASSPSHCSSALRVRSDSSKSVRFVDIQYEAPRLIPLIDSSTVLCSLLTGRTSLVYDFINDCRLVLDSEVLRMPVFRSPHCAHIKTIIIVFRDWDWKIRIQPSFYWGGGFITVGDVFDAIYSHLGQPIRQSTWCHASADRQQLASRHCRARGGQTKRRIDWLGGISVFRNLKFYSGSIDNDRPEGGVWLISFNPTSVIRSQ